MSIQETDDTSVGAEVRHPEVEVKLTERDGNAFAIMGAVRRELSRAGVPSTEIEEFTTEATDGDYDHLLRTCMRWVNVT